jgi:hypothetical protein
MVISLVIPNSEVGMNPISQLALANGFTFVVFKHFFAETIGFLLKLEL